MIDKVCRYTSYELLEPGLLHMSDNDADNAIDELSKKLKDKYGDFIKNYTDEVISSDDDETYCFKKHSEEYWENRLTNRGFTECVKGWVPFMDKFGSWFPDLNWNEVKEKLDSNPNKYILIKKPLENHNYEYYFSVFKKSININLQEQIRRILREELYSPSSEEYIPNKFVAHKSNPVWRKNIKKTGLQTSVGECYQTHVGGDIECKPAIFATDSLNEKDMFDSTYDDDIWLIDTECAGVTWHKDKHFEGGDYKHHILTFDSIPVECIKLHYKGTGKSY